MEQIDNLKELINQGDVDTAIKQLDQLLQDSSVEKEKDTLYYLRGNAYRKKGDWKQALDNYQYAIEINPGRTGRSRSYCRSKRQSDYD